MQNDTKHEHSHDMVMLGQCLVYGALILAVGCIGLMLWEGYRANQNARTRHPSSTPFPDIVEAAQDVLAEDAN